MVRGLFLLLLTTAGALWGGELPGSARRALDARYPGWRPAPIAAPIAEWFREYRFAWAPNQVRGDFDGDGTTDYALLIVARGRERAVALMGRRAGTYQVQELADDPAEPYVYLLFYAKGSKDFDFQRGRPLRYLNDSLGLMYFDKTPLTLTWRGGRFQRSLAISDEEAEGK
jgi:hypothetical protein